MALSRGKASWKSVLKCHVSISRNLSAALLEDIAKPLKHLVEGQNKARRPVS